ncbi:hypothetical protein DSO57_1028025 [Entomophthora muscae]|uniref:Uncharacterized protein n=1 Tax=Entomophthora muscae TaxID=34485 RepID=A0ACC2SQQ6_9FUNG|nr:hypothetical protein DSO57_1028025 [Entomophthora muscae]
MIDSGFNLFDLFRYVFPALQTINQGNSFLFRRQCQSGKYLGYGLIATFIHLCYF